MNRTNRNEQNSSTKQALLDMEKVATVSPDDGADKFLKAVKSLLKLADKQPKLLREADKIFNQHRYNERNLHFTKIQNYKKQQIIFNLTAKECQLLLYMLTFMSQANTISIKQGELAKDLKSSKRDVGSTLKSLEQRGCITKLQQSKEFGTIYMVNPEIASVGKHDNHGLFQKITPPEQLNEFLTETNNLTADVMHFDISYTDTDSNATTVRANFKIAKDE